MRDPQGTTKGSAAHEPWQAFWSLVIPETATAPTEEEIVGQAELDAFLGPSDLLLNPPTAWMQAVADAADIDALRATLATVEDIDEREAMGATPLMVALRKDAPESYVHLLLDHGAHPRSRDAMDVTPLHLAAINGNVAIVKRLLEAGSDVDARDLEGMTPLARAMSADRSNETVALLLDHFACPNARDAYGRQILHIAAASQAGTDVIDALLAAGADVEGLDGDDWTPLAIAVTQGRADVVRRLLDAGADPDARPPDGRWPCLLLAAAEEPSLVEMLLAAGASPNLAGAGGFTPLMVAVARGDTTMAEQLLDAGADPRATGPNETNALELAILARHPDTVADVVALLRRHGAVHAHDERLGITAVMVAAGHGFVDVLRALIAAGEPVNARCIYGSALGIAAMTDRSGDTTDTLLRAGADPEVLALGSRTPLMLAMEHDAPTRVKRLLIEAVAAKRRRADSWGPLWRTMASLDADMVAHLLSFEPNLEDRDEDGWTALQAAAAWRAHRDVLGALLEAGAVIDAQDATGRTALMLAATCAPDTEVERVIHEPRRAEVDDEFGGREILPWDGANPAADLVQRLITAGTNVDARDHLGRSPLIYASWRAGDVSVIEMLLEAGAMLDAVDVDGATALSIARRFGETPRLAQTLERADNRNVTADDRSDPARDRFD